MPDNHQSESSAPAKSVKSRLSVAMAQGRAAQTTQRLRGAIDSAPPTAPGVLQTQLPDAAKAAVQAKRVAPRKRKSSEAKPEKEKGKRQRVRPETRAQMLERLTNPLVTLHEASVLLRVCTATVRRYSNSGQLAHLRTEGGQRRFYLKDVLNLLKEIESRKK